MPESGNSTMRGTHNIHTANGADTWSIVGSDDSAPKLSEPSYTPGVLRRTEEVYKHEILSPLGYLLVLGLRSSSLIFAF
jgi:hypothetical protein